MGWELTRAAVFDSKQIARLLDEGWEPFAVSEGNVWFRLRPVPMIHQPIDRGRR